MKTGKQLLIAFLLLLLPLMHVSAQNQEATTHYLGEVSTGMKNTVQQTNWQGVSITMYSNLNDSIPFSQYWSTSEGVKTGDIPIDENDRFLVRSFTKTLTATVILQLQEEGRVHIDSALSNYIEPVTNVDSTITLRDLLSMSANVCNYIQNARAIIDEDPTRIFSTREILELTIPEGPCNVEKAYDYNDTNFQLLGLVIEAVDDPDPTYGGFSPRFNRTARVYEGLSYIAPHPWGLGNGPKKTFTISLAPTDIDPNNLNGVWEEDNGVTMDQFGESLNAVLTAQTYSAGVVGRTDEMIRVLAAILTPGELLSQESIDIMTDFGDDNYGLGLQRFDFNDEFEGEDHVLYGHMGVGLNASTTFYNPIRKIGFSFAANLSQQDADTLLYNLSAVTKSNYEKLLNCRLENGCVDMTTPNPLKGRVVEYLNSYVAFAEYVDWDQRIDTARLVQNSFLSDSIIYDSLGQGFNVKLFDEIEFKWELQEDVIWLNQTLNEEISIDYNNYLGVPNPVFGNLKNINDFIGIYEIEFFNGRSDTTVETNGNCYLKSNYSIPVDPNYIRESKNSLVTYNGRWEDICYGDITNISTPEPSFHIQGVVSNSDTGPYWWFYFDAYLPPSYYSDTTSTYPVVYFVPDSASTLDDFEGLTHSMKDMMSNDSLEESIFVMLGNSNSTLGHSIEEAIEIVSTTTIPDNFRGNEKACIMGVSSGGVIAMNAAIQNPENFDCIISHSAQLELSPKALQNEVAVDSLAIQIYFDTDLDDELNTYSFNESFSDSLNKYGYKNQYFYEVYEGSYSGMLDERFKTSLAFIDSVFKGGSVPTVNEFIEEKPFETSLNQNYPNPFNPSTNISFELPEAALVQLKVYNLLGQEVANLVDGRMNSGSHTVNFDASRLSSGVYIYRLSAGNQSFTKKMMLIK